MTCLMDDFVNGNVVMDSFVVFTRARVRDHDARLLESTMSLFARACRAHERSRGKA